MKPPISTTVPAFLNVTVRLLLTLAVIVAFLCILALLVKIHSMFTASRTQLQNQSIYIGDNVRPAPSDSDIHPFWPEFPRNSAENIQSEVINGVQVLSEEWESSAPASDVLSYYREQMTARGWRDVTEETYNLQSGLREAADNGENERYVDNYRNIMDSNLVLNHGEWSMQVVAEPDKKNTQKTVVKILAAATPSIRDFFGGMALALAGHSGQPNQPLDVVQHSAGQRYHTTIVVKSATPTQAFQEALAEFGSQGWRPIVFLPKLQARSGNFAWLVKGKGYAALSVSALPQGTGSSVTFTEVTPD